MSFTVTVILVLVAIVVILGAVVYVMAKSNKEKKTEVQALKSELEIAHENVKQLTEYIRNSDKIRKEEKEIAEKIKEAKTDEEVHKIIDDIIALNNSRVSHDEG